MNDNLKPSRRRVFVFWGALALMVVVVFGAYLGIRIYRYRNTGPMTRQEFDKAYNAYLDIFRNDTYGGATPEETLRLFVEALKAGDVELASKYFMPDDNGSREKWERALQSDKEKGNLAELAQLFERAQSPKFVYDNAASFRILNENGDVVTLIQLVNNGKVWKIESL